MAGLRVADGVAVPTSTLNQARRRWVVHGAAMALRRTALGGGSVAPCWEVEPSGGAFASRCRRR
uniref:Uncharacterized protein n=1 Tax=Arundo donax TaxID=35708 RepID=A0A0A9BVJ5_ARUDO